MPRRDLGDAAVNALTRSGIGSALLAALGVYLVFVLTSLARTLVYVSVASGGSQSPLGSLPDLLPTILLPPLPLAIGVFLAFWQIAPIAPQLRMAHVVTRAVLAAVVGSAVSGILTFLLEAAPRLGGAQSPLAVLALSMQRAIPSTFELLAASVIAVPLAALLLWGWLQSHPPTSTARGALDEV